MGIKRKVADVVAEDQPSQHDIHPSRKVRVEYGEKDTRLAKVYNNLSDEISKIRLGAAAELIRTLRDASGPEKSRALDRLVKGLCSSRKAARSGFFVALTEFLTLIGTTQSVSEDAFDTTSVLTRIVAITEFEGAASKRERRDYALGRCMALNAILKSQYIKLFPECWTELVNHMVLLAATSPMLRRECGAVLHEAIVVMKPEDSAQQQRGEILLEKLHTAKLLKSPESIATWLSFRELFPDAKFPVDVWHKNDPMSSKERATVVNILRGSGDGDTEERTTTGAPQSIPSFAWPVVLKVLWTHKKDKDFQQFWQEAIDDGHFNVTASTERKSLGFQILSTAIRSAPARLVSSLLTKNLLRCLINHRSKKTSHLHESSKAPLTMLVARAKADPSIVCDAFMAVIGKNGAVNFDTLTKTKTAEGVLLHADDDGLKAVLSALDNMISTIGETEHMDVEGGRRSISDILLTIARLLGGRNATEGQVSKSMSRILDQLLIIFAKTGYLPQSGISTATQELYRSRLTSALGCMIKGRMPGTHATAFGVVKWIEKETDAFAKHMSIKADEAVLGSFRGAFVNITKLEHQSTKDVNSKTSSSASALMLLYAMSMLQGLDGDADGISLLEDLDVCYQSWAHSDNNTVVLVEILLSFLSQQSSVYRNLAEQVFAVFAPDLTEDGFQSMLDILQKSENSTGQEELFEANGGDVEDDHDDDEDASDVEVVGVDGSEVGSGTSSDTEDDDSGNSVESEDDETKAFEAKLAQALGASKTVGDDVMDEDSDGSDMDDDQMMAMEGHLTTIFQERAKQSSKKQDSKDAKANIVNFKNRVLDLLNTYVKQEHCNMLVLSLIVPLVDVTRTTSSRQTSEKAFAVLRQLSDSCNKDKRFPTEDPKLALAVLKEVHQRMAIKAIKLHGTACSRASLFLAKTLVTADAAHFDDVAKLYFKLQKEWYREAKSHVPASVFTEWTSWCVATKQSRVQQAA